VREIMFLFHPHLSSSPIKGEEIIKKEGEGKLVLLNP